MRLIDADALKDNFPNARADIFENCRNCTCLDNEQINQIIDSTPTVNGWISVKDRLPEKNQIVIASDGEHTWDVGMYKSLCGKPSEWNWKKNTVKTVLWWMPKDGALPEPPKEESDGNCK